MSIISDLTVDLLVGSGMSVAILQDDGEYGAVIVSVANMLIDTKVLQAQWITIGGGKILV